VIGDQPCDIALGQRVGGTTLQVQTGDGAQVMPRMATPPDYDMQDLQEAADIIQRMLSPTGQVTALL